MKQFDDYWQLLVEKNGGLKDDGTMKISVASFRKSMEQAFRAGYDRAKYEQKSMDNIMDLFKGKAQ